MELHGNRILKLFPDSNLPCALSAHGKSIWNVSVKNCGISILGTKTLAFRIKGIIVSTSQTNQNESLAGWLGDKICKIFKVSFFSRQDTGYNTPSHMCICRLLIKINLEALRPWVCTENFVAILCQNGGCRTCRVGSLAWCRKPLVRPSYASDRSEQQP
jgi:hypothetical protein